MSTDSNQPFKTIPWPLVLIGLALLLAALLIGLFMWSTELTKPQPLPPTIERPSRSENNEPESTRAEAEVDSLQVMSNSDELSTIAADVEGTDLTSLTAEIGAIEAILNQ